MSLSIQDINYAIMTQTFTNEQLSSILSAVQVARTQLAKSTKRQLRNGCTVKFTSNRNGTTYTGTVDKIKTKFVLVRTGLGLFNVPANMLEVVA
jgi:hypothetical protein